MIGFPKPPRREKKPRKPIKTNVRLRTKIWKPIRKVKVRKVNKARAASNFRRCYHSWERKQFVISLACIVEGCPNRAVNAHVCDDGTKGMSRKSGYKCIAPTCTPHHDELDQQIGPVEFERKYALNLELCAAETEAAWQEHLADVALFVATGGEL